MPEKRPSELLPTASYHAYGIDKQFTVSPDAPHTTNGSTTGPSEYLISVTEGEFVDRDKPSESKDTRIGRLRAYVTTLQDDVNRYLTERMKQASTVDVNEEDLERRVLDEGGEDNEDDDDDDDDTKA